MRMRNSTWKTSRWRGCLALLLWFVSAVAAAGNVPIPLTGDSATAVISIGKKKPFLKRVGGALYEFVKDFSRVDTHYVEPQKYNFTVMVQNTNTYELYRLNTNDGFSVTFAPEPTVKLGPYVGWRWVFLGYTVGLRRLSGNNKEEFDLSFYSSQIGVDFFYRSTGNNYKIKSISFNEKVDPAPILGAPFNGFEASIRGFNLYYIFNHRRFSYPAAFSQSTIQRRSVGSMLIGMGYTRHRLSIDIGQLDGLLASRLRLTNTHLTPADSASFGRVNYTDTSLSAGYGYNWAFARNWLLAGSLSLGLGYKRTTGDVENEKTSFREFLFNSMAVDGVGRFALVWNNSRWYAGASAILHAYNYRKSRFSTNNMFGNLNFYVGYNFGKRSR